jgi:ATP-dependent protease HslVU (ClpYQ) peptidase subunit
VTTVVWSGKEQVMACDSCWALAGLIDTLAIKISRLKGGALLGQAGANDARPIMALLNDVRTPGQMPSLEALLAARVDFAGLLVLPKGQVYKVMTTFISEANWDKEASEGDLGIWEIKRPFAAVGSGSELAMGALAAGASARRAVRVACEFDINSRPPIHVVPLSTMSKSKAK